MEGMLVCVHVYLNVMAVDIQCLLPLLSTVFGEGGEDTRSFTEPGIH